MGCCTHRKKQTTEFPDQKWDFINLADFKSKGCGTPFAYGYLWFSLILSVTVYTVDTFTAVQLLIFDRWSSKIEPDIKFSISKWIFAGCIIASFLNLGYEGWRAIRVIRRENVADSYLDNLAVMWESIRIGKGQGWRRFLVFAELTKSKKGAEYIALFTYFSLQSWIRVLLCSGPRQVVNAFTLKSVFQIQLASNSDNVGDSIMGFFNNIKILAEEDYRQAVILSGMCFTFVVWAFSAIFLIIAVFFYVFFLFHWIPRTDGGLSGYCERKVNKALLQIVTKKVNKALAKGETNRIRAEVKAARMKGEKPVLERAATLPVLPDMDPRKNDSLPNMPVLGRTDTNGTLPVYTSQPPTPNTIEMTSIFPPRPRPSRNGTKASNSSFSSRAPLVSTAADMGYADLATPAPTLPDVGYNSGPPSRSGTSVSQRSYSARSDGTPKPFASNSSLRGAFTASPAPIDGPYAPPCPPPYRQITGRAGESYSESRGSGQAGRQAPAPRRYNPYAPDGRSSPAPSMNSHRGPALQRQQTPFAQPHGHNPSQDSFVSARPTPPRGPTPFHRNPTAPPQTGDGFSNYAGDSGPTHDMRGNNYHSQSSEWAPQARTGPGSGYDYGDVESQRGYRY